MAYNKNKPVKVTKKSLVEDIIVKRIHGEYLTGESNNTDDDRDFELALDMFDNVRGDRDYDWQSNIPIPEFLNAIQGQAADDANAYFARKEFVSVNIQSTDPDKQEAARAAKDLIDKTLSRTSLDYFQKYMRLSMTKNIGGRSYIRAWWEQDLEPKTIQVTQQTILENVDIAGNERVSDEQEPAVIEEEVDEDVVDVIRDQFNFDVIDPRNIRYSGETVTNIRNKNWIVLRYDTTLEDLEKDEEKLDYINLDRIRGIKLSGETELKKKTIDFDLRATSPKQDNDSTPVKNLMIIERWGKDYAKVVSRDINGDPEEVDYGYDANGEKLKDAELVHLVQNIAVLNGESSEQILIRHIINPYIDARGNRYIPIARGLCYIHPTNDRGFGDDVGSRGLQKAINDTFAATTDNTLLGMLKIIKQPEGFDEEEMPLRIAPMEVWPSGTEVVDFQNNTMPALNMMNLLTEKFNETNARDSGVPVLSSAAATTVARAEKQVNVRSQYKNLVFENTMMNNLYWMIVQMSGQFMLAETAIDMLGENVALSFNADLDYIYHPISESIDTDSTKGAKIDRLNTTMGYVVNSQNPNSSAVVNNILKQIFRLLGKEEEEATKGLFDESAPVQEPAGGAGGAGAGELSAAQSPVNQSGLPQPGGQIPGGGP